MERLGQGKKGRSQMTHTDEALPIRHYGTVVCLGMGRGIWAALRPWPKT